MRFTLLVAVALLVSPLAGPLGAGEDPPPSTPGETGGLSEKQYEIRDGQEVWVEASDGTLLHNAVYRPDTDEPVPVFINFSPYWGDHAEHRGDAFAHYMIEEYVPRGYAVVLSSIRGTGHSEGCFELASDREVQDLYEVVDHFADADWSNGSVIAGGKSYDSTTLNGLIAKNPHPSLEGVFHVSGITDVYRYNYRQGVAYEHGRAFNTYFHPLVAFNEYFGPFNEGEHSLARLVDDAACPELAETQAHGLGTGVHGLKTDFWLERAWPRHVGASGWNGSIFFVHGLQDWNVNPAHVLPWLAELPEDVQVKGWLHQDVDEEGRGHVYPMRADWNATMLRWMDEIAKDKDTSFEHGFEAEGTDGVWRESDTWPPANTSHATLELSLESTGLPVGPAETTATIPTGDRVLRLAGQPTIEINATSATADPVLTAKLYTIGPDGEWTWVNEAVQRGIYRNGLEQPEPVPVGESLTYELSFFPQDDVVQPDEDLLLVVGEDPRYGDPTPSQRELVDYGSPAQLTLPLAPTDTALDDQPEEIPCFAC